MSLLSIVQVIDEKLCNEFSIFAVILVCCAIGLAKLRTSRATANTARDESSLHKKFRLVITDKQ